VRCPGGWLLYYQRSGPPPEQSLDRRRPEPHPRPADGPVMTVAITSDTPAARLASTGGGPASARPLPSHPTSLAMAGTAG
jgi:hypothetical protein